MVLVVGHHGERVVNCRTGDEYIGVADGEVLAAQICERDRRYVSDFRGDGQHLAILNKTSKSFIWRWASLKRSPFLIS